MTDGEKYPYPFSKEVLENRDIVGARRKSQELGRWVFAPKENPSRQEDITFKIRIIFEPNTLTFVDEDDGVIKFALVLTKEDHLFASGGIYNPKEGKSTLTALLDILKYISKITNKNIVYRTARVNTTKKLEELLVDMGFVKDGNEYKVEVRSSDSSVSEYPELDSEINRLNSSW